MKIFVVNFKRAAFGWPVYTARNLAGYANELHGRAKASRLLAAVVFWTITTGAWATLWVAAVWLLAQLANLAIAR
jgi:hypothetical protein